MNATATEVTVKSVFRMTLHAIMSLLSMAPQSVNVIATNLDSLQRLSNAGNMLATDVESSATFNHEINMIDLATRKTKAERVAAASLSA